MKKILICVAFLFTPMALADIIFIDRVSGQEVNRIESPGDDTIQYVGESKSSATNNTKGYPVGSVTVPAISAYSQDLCVVGRSAGVNTGTIALSGGTTVVDVNCERMKLSKLLYDYGMKVAAVTMLCQDERVFESMGQAGTPCPFEGKIGAEAKTAWDRYDFERPDYDKYIERMNEREHKVGYSDELYQRAVEEAYQKLKNEAVKINENIKDTQ